MIWTMNAMTIAASLTLMLALSLTAQAQPQRKEYATMPQADRLEGRLEGDAASGLRFTIKGQPPIPLERIGSIRFESADAAGAETGAGAAATPPFQARLTLDQKLSGRLMSLDERELTMDLGDPAHPIRIGRSGLLRLTQQPGEALVFEDGFEALDSLRWTLKGKAEATKDAALTGSSSLRLEGSEGSASFNMAEAIAAGRLELGFRDDDPQASQRSCRLILNFRGSPKSDPSSIAIVLAGPEAELGVESKNGPSLAVQRLRRAPGWRRLTAEFGADRTVIAIDGKELAFGGGVTGPLTEIRATFEPNSSASASKPPVAFRLDDLRLVKFAEPSASIEIDPDQDQIRLISGDQIFGAVTAADARGLMIAANGKTASFPWSEVAEIGFRRAVAPSRPLEGLWVQIERDARPHSDPNADGRDWDRVEGVLLSVTDQTLVLDLPFTTSAPALILPRAQVRSLRPLGRAWRWVLDRHPRHIGNDLRPDYDPPMPQGKTADFAFTLDPDFKVNEPIRLVIDSQGVESETKGEFSDLVRDKGMRANVLVNGKPLDYLNRHIVTDPSADAVDHVRLTIPGGWLKPGENQIRIDQTSVSDNPTNIDDWLLLRIALERTP